MDFGGHGVFGVVVVVMILVDGLVLGVVGCGCLWDGPLIVVITGNHLVLML